MSSVEIPVACRANSFNGTNENIWLAMLTSVIASGLKEGTDAMREADRLCMRIANRKWAGPLSGKYFSKDAIQPVEDSLAGARVKFDALMIMQDKEWADQYDAREKATEHLAATGETSLTVIE